MPTPVELIWDGQCDDAGKRVAPLRRRDWAVDWDNQSGPFHNRSQTFRTRKDGKQ